MLLLAKIINKDWNLLKLHVRINRPTCWPLWSKRVLLFGRWIGTGRRRRGVCAWLRPPSI